MGWRAKVCCCMLSRLARATVARGGLKRGNVWCVVVKTWFMSPDFIFISTIKWSGSAVPLQVYTVALYRAENPWKKIPLTSAPPNDGGSSGVEESSARDGGGSREPELLERRRSRSWRRKSKRRRRRRRRRES